MKTTARAAALMLLAALSFASPAMSQTRGPAHPGTTAIVGATVIPMTGGSAALADATVLVRDGRIVAVGPRASVTVPAGTRVIDAAGRWLIPGLADMHTHLFADGETPDSAAPHELGVMVANGVTATRIMIGTPQHLEMRAAVASGRVLGPQMWVASPQMTGEEGENASVVTTPAQAHAAVAAAHDAGYDFIKLTTAIAPDVYEAIVAEAGARGIPLIGHVDLRVGAARALAAGQHVEHLDAYLEHLLAADAPDREGLSNAGVFRPRAWATLAHIDESRIAGIARMTAESGTYTTPTLMMFNRAFGAPESDVTIRSRPDWQLQPPHVRATYLRGLNYVRNMPVTAEQRARYASLRSRLTKAISDAGGRIMAGSDTPEWFHVYGFALHRELEELVAAGLTPLQALAAATTTPARFFGAADDWGTIAPGMRADLVLLDADPLADIRNTQRIRAVAVGGRWLERAELDLLIANASRAIDGAE